MQFSLLGVISTVSLILSLGGNVLLNFQKKFGYVVWTVGDFSWIAVNLLSERVNIQQIIMYVVYIVLNVCGFVQWSRKRKENFIRDERGGVMGYEKVPDGYSFSTEFETYIIAFCPDSDEWFVTNKRFFYYEFPMEFRTEEDGISYFRKHASTFYQLEIDMEAYRPSFYEGVVFLSNTNELIRVADKIDVDEAYARAREDDFAEF